jgi:hypothetical protein
MKIPLQSPASTLGPATRSAAFAGFATLAICAPALCQTTDGPLASAMRREAVRLFAAEQPAAAALPNRGKSTASDWARVRAIAPRTEIILTVRGSQPFTRYVVMADESQLTVLNVSDPTLPADARKVLLDIASLHPAFFAIDGTPGSFVSDNVKVGPDGVFVADRKVADIGQFVEKIAQRDVVRIKAGGLPSRSRRLGPWAAIPGFFLGASVGAAVDCAITGCGPGTPNIPTGVGVGMIVGAVASVVAPRRAAATFLGVGGGLLAGGMTGATIEGDCRPDHPCEKGANIGIGVGVVTGGILGYRLAGPWRASVIYHAP